jgi:hypothetical protein
VPTRAELYRQRAMECEALAERANDADRKARLREAAKQWRIWPSKLNSWMPRKPPQNLPGRHSWQCHPIQCGANK